MPVEIRELIIRATIQGDREAQAAQADGRDVARPPAGALTAHELDRIVAACVKRLVRVMKRSDER